MQLLCIKGQSFKSNKHFHNILLSAVAIDFLNTSYDLTFQLSTYLNHFQDQYCYTNYNTCLI